MAVAALPLTQLFPSVQVLPAAVGAVVCATTQVKLVVAFVETSFLFHFGVVQLNLQHSFVAHTNGQWEMAKQLLSTHLILFSMGAPLLSALNLSGLSTELEDKDDSRVGRGGVWVLGSGAWMYAVYVILVGCQVLAFYIVFLFTFYYYTLYPLKLLMQDVFEFEQCINYYFSFKE